MVHHSQLTTLTYWFVMIDKHSWCALDWQVPSENGITTDDQSGLPSKAEDVPKPVLCNSTCAEVANAGTPLSVHGPVCLLDALSLCVGLETNSYVSSFLAD